ncbi:MAG: hypothetical protein JW765_12445 [Deltaproteobacteria bacterium]|nr:hypothetical protein [Candidatus Zymogenaceae bacterium]
MSKKLKKGTGAARIIWVFCLTVFLASVTIIAVFYYYFGNELISDAVRRVVERTVGYRVSLTGIHMVSPGRITVEAMYLVIGSTVFSSGAATLELGLGINPPLAIKKVTVHAPSVSLDISPGGGENGQQIVRRIMEMDIVVVDGEFVVIDGARLYAFLDVDMSYERGIVGATLTIAGSARTEGMEDGVILGGPFSALMHISGTYPDISARGDITTEGSGYRIGEYLFSGEQLDARIRLDPDSVEATDAAISGLSITEDGGGIGLDNVSATGSMKNESRGTLMLSDVVLSVPVFGDVSLDLAVEENGRWKMTSGSESLRLSTENLKRLGDHLPDFLAGWEIKGRSHGILTMGTVDTDDGSIAGNLEVDLINAGFSSPDAVFIGEGISATARIQFRDDIKRGLLFDGSLDAHDFGLLLWGFFIDFKNERISMGASGRINDDGDVKGLACEILVPSVLTAGVSGDVDFDTTDTSGDLSYRLKAVDMGSVFDIFFRNYFNNRVAWIYGGTIAGLMDCRGTIKGNLSAPRVSGHITVAGSSLDFPDIDTRIEGISVSMPFSLDLSGGPKSGTGHRFVPGDFGKIAFSRAVVGGVEIGGITVSPALAGNAVTFGQDVVLSASGGTVTVGGFKAGDIFNENRTISLSLHVDGIDIAGIFTKEKALDLKGELSGDISEVRIEEKKLFTSGNLTAKIFKGEVNIENIWGQNIYDAGRRLGCDVAFTGLDLGALTQTIDVGRVTGIAQGRISDLIFSYGGAERFVFDVRTVDKRGQEKRVSVEFVDKLTILGSGSNLFSGVLKSGLNRFVHDYNYSQIGIHLELKDDYFTLRGTIHEGDTEYFIKRSGITGINVINQNPNNRIRFNDMMRRLERINVKNTNNIKIETK